MTIEISIDRVWETLPHPHLDRLNARHILLIGTTRKYYSVNRNARSYISHDMAQKRNACHWISILSFKQGFRMRHPAIISSAHWRSIESWIQSYGLITVQRIRYRKQSRIYKRSAKHVLSRRTCVCVSYCAH